MVEICSPIALIRFVYNIKSTYLLFSILGFKLFDASIFKMSSSVIHDQDECLSPNREEECGAHNNYHHRSPNNKHLSEIPTIILSDSFHAQEYQDDETTQQMTDYSNVNNHTASGNLSDFILNQKDNDDASANLLHTTDSSGKQFESTASCDSAYDSSVETPTRNLSEDSGDVGDDRKDDGAFLHPSGIEFLTVQSSTGLSGSSLTSSCSSLLSDSSMDRSASPSNVSPINNENNNTVIETNVLKVHRDMLFRKLSSSSSCSLR